MQGDERVRHCGLCRKNVYNLSSMPRAEAAALLAGNTKGELCVRFYRRSDGTVMTSDCSTSVRVKLHDALRTLPRMAAGAAGAAGAAMVAASVVHAAPGKPARSGHAQQVVQVSIPQEPPVPHPVMMGAPPRMPEPPPPADAPQQGKLESEQAATAPTDDQDRVKPSPTDAQGKPRGPER